MEEQNPFELAGRLEKEEQEQNPFELAGQAELKKKDYPESTSSTGGKAGALETPSIGSSPFLQKAKERAEQGAPTVLSVKKETVKEVGLPSYTPTKEEELKAPTQKQFEQQALLPTYQKESALDISKKQTQVAIERSKALDELIKTKKEAQSSYEKIRNLDNQIESFEPQFEKFKTTAEAFQPDIQEYKNLTSQIAEIKNKSNSFVLEYNNEYQKLAPKLEAYKQIFENEKLPNEKRQDAYENYNGIVSILKNKEKLLDQAVAQNEQGIGDLEAKAKSFDETIKKATANQAGFSQLYSQYKSLIDERNKSAEGLGVYEKRMSDAQNQIKQKLFEQSQLEDVRQQKLEKEYSTWQNFFESLPKMGIEAVAGVSDMLNVLGFSGDPESPETRDEVKKETRQNIEKLRKFGDSFITQELPKNYEKLFEGQFSLKKLANVGFNAIASTAPTIAAGLIGGPVAGVAAGAGMAFGESKEIMKEAGLTEEQAEAAAFGLSIPIGLLENYGAEDIVKLFSKEAVEYSTKIFLKNIAGRTLTKEQLFNEAKNTIGQIIKDGAPQLLKEGVKESGTEMSQGLVNEVAKQVAQEFTGVDLDENMSWSDYLKNQAEVRGEELVGGFIGGTSMQTIGLGLKSAGEGIFPTFNPSAYQKALELLDPSKMEAFSQEVQQEVQDKVLTQEQADLAFRNIQLIQETNNLIPATINNKDLRTEALNLLIEKKETQKEIEGKDEALVAPQKARIEEINKRLSDIANGKTEEVVTPEPSAVTLSKNTTPTEEKYGTIDRGDGKGVVDLTRAEYEAELAKQGQEVKPMVTEVQFTTKQRERRDQEIEEVQQLRNDLGQDVELINDIPAFVDDVVDRMDLGMMVAPEMLSDAIKELDNQFDKLQAYRNDPARTHTTAQIDAMIDVLGAVKSEIQDYQIKQQENEQQQPTTATQTEPTAAPTEGVEAGQEQVTPTTQEEKGKSSVPSKTDKAYQEAQGVTERVSKAHPEASVLVLPKGNDLSLTALYVGKEKRGKGIGSGVLESVKAEADKLGKKVVLDATNELDNDTDLERLGEFYERNGFVKVGENKFEYTPKKNQLLTPNINQNETVNENVREIGNGQKDGQKGDVSQEAKSDVQEGEEKVAEGEEPTAEQVDKASKAVGTTPSNLLDLYRISRDLFGQNRVKAFASAIAMDRMIGAMAKRAGIPKQRMYEKLQFRKASEEFVKGLSDRAKVLWQIVGENAQLAQDVRDNLQVARDMETAGKDAKTIRLATGWEKGKDGKWRYEIMDLKLKSNKSTATDILGATIKNEDFLKAYPQLENIGVIIKIGENFDNTGSYTPRVDRSAEGLFDLEPEITIKAKTKKEAESVLAHEIQHAIQDIEGFAKGGSPSGLGSVEALVKQARKERRKLGEKYNELEQERAELLKIKNPNKEQQKRFEETIKEQNKLEEDARLLKEVEENPQNVSESKIQELAYKGYKSLAGEVEARNVQTRMGMTPKQRRETLLSETEDVARDEQIVLFDSKGIQMQVDAWHGSPYQFDKFTTEKIGTGEGAQAFGWGLYFTDLESIARDYATKLAKQQFNGINTMSDEDIQKLKNPNISQEEFDEIKKRNIDRIEYILNSIPELENIGVIKKGDKNPIIGDFGKQLYDLDLNALRSAKSVSDIISSRNLYKVSLHQGKAPDQYTWLEWDKPLLKNNIEKIKNGLDFLNKQRKEREQNAFKEARAHNELVYEREEIIDNWLANEAREGIRPPNIDSINKKIKESYDNLSDDIKKNGVYQSVFPKSSVIYRDLRFKLPDEYVLYEEAIEGLDTDDINDFETGGDFYKSLTNNIGAKEASLFLLSAGIDGIKYPAESISRGATSDTARGFNYVVFDENAVSIEEVIKFQKDAEKARGAMMMALDGQAIIYALSDPNVSTPLHEMAHVFEHYLTESERQTIIRNAGTGAWTTETSEYFARGFEKYLAEGVAPNKELQKVFEKFKEWLTEIYNGITGSEIDIQLNDEMRAIYAQMFGEEEVNSKFKPNEKITQKEDGKPLPEGVSGVRAETEERQTSPELRPQEEEVRSIIDNAVANFYAINEATKRSEKREAAKEYRQNLEKMPTVKNIFDNIKTIFAQLEAEGVITKSKDCP